MKIYEAAVKVLESSGEPVHANEIYLEIVGRELYQFKAKKPVSVLTQSLTERCVGNNKNKDPVFIKVAPGFFKLLTVNDK